MRRSRITTLIACLALFVYPCLLYADEKPEVFVQMGHSSEIQTLVFSRDGKYMASADQGGVIKLWEVSSGKEIRTLKGHGGGVIALAFLNDGRSIASAGGAFEETIRIWDITTAKETFKFSTNFFKGSGTKIVKFSADGVYALVAKSNSTYGQGDGSTKIKVVEIATGREVRDLSGIKGAEQKSASSFKSPSRSFEKAILSPDGRQVLAVFDYSLKLIDIKSGEVIRTYQAEKYPLSPNMKSAAFSSDGKMILSSTNDGLVLFDTATGKVLAMFGEDVRTDEVLISPDGKYAITANTDPIGVFKMWDIAGRKMVKTFTHGSYISTGSYGYTSLAFTPSSAYLASGGRDKTIKLWDIYLGAEIKRFSSAVSGVNSADVSADSRYALSASGKEIFLWDIATGNREMVFRGHADIVNTVRFSPDDKVILSASGSFNGISDNTLRLWDLANGREIRKFTGHMDGIATAAFSPDGRFILSGPIGNHDPTARLWDAATGMEIRRFNHSIWVMDEYDTSKKRDAAGASYFIGFSQDGKTAVINRQDHTNIYQPIIHYDVYDTSNWRKQRTIESFGYGGDAALSPDGNYLLCVYQLVEISTGIKRRDYEGWGYSSTAAFSPEMNYFVLAAQPRVNEGWEKRIEIRETSSGRLVKTFYGHSGDIKSVKFINDGKHLLSAGEDGTVRIWNSDTGKEIAQFISFNDGEWIVIAAEGYYKSSVNGDKHLNVRIGNNIYGIDQYRSAFYKPQIVEALLKLGDPQKAIAETIGADKDKPPLTIASLQNIEPPFVVIKSPEEGGTVGSRSAEITLYVEDRRQTIKKVTIYINGRVAAFGEGRGVKVTAQKGIIKIPEGKKYLDLKIPVSLDRGENLVEVTAFNGYSEGRKSIRIYTEAKATKSRDIVLPNLWILSIGINKYHDNKLTPLSYAVADAEGIVNAFKAQKGKLFREVNSLIINDNSPVKPSRDNITDNLDYVKRAGHNDVVILFIAGHGMNDDSGEFYFLPSDAVISEDGSIKKSKAISWRDIKAILDIPAKKLIFADTCHSEGVSGKKTRGVDNDRFVKELQEANAVIFTSSRGRELSQESEKWKHGAFTYALIDGIKGKADLIKDGKISMKELDAYVSETVPKITNGAQHPITNTPDGYINFPVAIVE